MTTKKVYFKGFYNNKVKPGRYSARWDTDLEMIIAEVEFIA